MRKPWAIGFVSGVGVAAIAVLGWQAMSMHAKAKAYDRMARRLVDDPAGLLFDTGGEALVNRTLQGIIDREKPDNKGKYGALFDPDAPPIGLAQASTNETSGPRDMGKGIGIIIIFYMAYRFFRHRSKKD